ncbi:MAG: hypothetical protein U0L05_07800 [Schaedlerella sp.]|nr:hypothetical protein [Schaedlerella sp.]
MKPKVDFCFKELLSDSVVLQGLLPKVKKQEYPESGLLNWMRFMNAEKKEEFEMLAKEDEYME